MVESKALLKWRSKKGKGEIMKPSTFEKIKESAARGGARNPEAVAGKAYWETARAKFKEQGKAIKRKMK